MKKIFVLTGEPSGDKLASTVIAKLKKNHSELLPLYVELAKTSIKYSNEKICRYRRLISNAPVCKV